MRILITGADGFIGRALVGRLLTADVLAGLGDRSREVVLLERRFAAEASDRRARCVAGDLADAAVLREAVEGT